MYYAVNIAVPKPEIVAAALVMKLKLFEACVIAATLVAPKMIENLRQLHALFATHMARLR